MTVVSAPVETERPPVDRDCDSCGRRFTVRAPLRRSDLDNLARVNGWDIGSGATWCPGCRCARAILSSS